jgi:hypothetical protein
MNFGRAIYARHGVALPAPWWDASTWTAVTFRYIRSGRPRQEGDAIDRDLFRAHRRRHEAYLASRWRRRSQVPR